MLRLGKYSQNLLSQQGKRFGTVILIFLLINITDITATENNGMGVKAIGMANAFVAVSDNPWSTCYNPAGLTQIKNDEWSAFFVPEQFGLPELKTTAFAAAIPIYYITIGLMAESFGFNLYKEDNYGIASAIKLDTCLALGLCLNYQNLNISRYGTSKSFILDGGILAHVTETVAIGFKMANITGSSMGNKYEKNPQVFELGACWVPINNLHLSVEIEKDVRYLASEKAGIEQIIFGVFALRAGFANNPDKFTSGFSVRYTTFEFGYAGYSQPDLGWTHQIEISFKLDH